MPATDVVVVGAGLAGCSVAAHLADHCGVLVLDQGPPGAEASSQNAGMVRRLGEDPYERALALRTAERLPEIPDASHVTGAVLGLVHDATHLHDAVAHLRARGVRVEAVTGADVPALAGAWLATAWYVPDERVADPSALLAAFLRKVRGRVRAGEAVTGIRVEGGRVVAVRTDRGEVPCGAVVLAAGAWSAALGATAGVRRPLTAVRRTLVQSAPHGLSRAGHPWVWLDDVGVYARPEAGGWLASPCDEVIDPPTGPGSRGPVEMAARALLVDKIERHLPALADARWTGGWTGLRTFAPDRRPILGEDPDVSGLWWAAGLGGFGVTCSLGVGEAVACWLRGEATPWIDRAGVSPGRAFPRRWIVRPDGALAGRLVPA